MGGAVPHVTDEGVIKWIQGAECWEAVISHDLHDRRIAWNHSEGGGAGLIGDLGLRDTYVWNGISAQH